MNGGREDSIPISMFDAPSSTASGVKYCSPKPVITENAVPSFTEQSRLFFLPPAGVFSFMSFLLRNKYI